jgi:serine/threonine protein kinase
VGETLWAGPADEPDRYRLWAVAGGGAEGKVYRATRELPDGHIDVAVKVTMPDRFGERQVDIDAVAGQWSAHAARLRNLRHPGLVGVQEAFVGSPPHVGGAVTQGRCAYFVMAWVDGHDYATWAASRPGDRMVVLENVADALDELHRAGQVHADVKPGNILVQTTTLPTGSTHASGVLVDFGLMRTITGTRPSQVAFSAGYAAPELWQGGPYSPASDLYALAGVVLFALSGENPPASADAGAEARRRLTQLAIPAATIDAVTAGLSADPGQRASGGCRAWLATARGGLTSTTLMVNPAGVGPATVLGPTPGPGAPGAPDAPPKRGWLRKASAAVALSLTVTVSVAVQHYVIADDGGDETAADAEPVDAATTTETTDEPTTTTAPVTPKTTLGDTSTSIGGPLTTSDDFLADISRVAGGTWQPSSELKIDGDTYFHGIASSEINCYSFNSVEAVEYSIDRRYTSLRGVVGLSDTSVSGLPVDVEISGDGASLWREAVQVGQPQPIDLDVTGVLRIKIVATRQFDVPSCPTVYAAIGDPALD